MNNDQYQQNYDFKQTRSISHFELFRNTADFLKQNKGFDAQIKPPFQSIIREKSPSPFKNVNRTIPLLNKNKKQKRRYEK